MSLFNPYAFTPFGQPATPGVSALRAIGAPASAAQLYAAQSVFRTFCAQTQLSAAPNQTAIGRLPDGTQYKITVVGAMTTMTVWPIAAPVDDSSGGIILDYLQHGFRRVWLDKDWRSEKITEGYCGRVVYHSTAAKKYFCDNFGAYEWPSSLPMRFGPKGRSAPAESRSGVSAVIAGYLHESGLPGGFSCGVITPDSGYVYLRVEGTEYTLIGSDSIATPSDKPVKITNALSSGSLTDGDFRVGNEAEVKRTAAGVFIVKLASNAAETVTGVARDFFLFGLLCVKDTFANVANYSNAVPKYIRLAKINGVAPFNFSSEQFKCNDVLNISSVAHLLQTKSSTKVRDLIGEFYYGGWISVVAGDIVNETEAWERTLKAQYAGVTFIRECVDFLGLPYRTKFRVTVNGSRKTRSSDDIKNKGVREFSASIPYYARYNNPWTSLEYVVATTYSDDISVKFEVGGFSIHLTEVDLVLTESRNRRTVFYNKYFGDAEIPSEETFEVTRELTGTFVQRTVVAYEEKSYITCIDEVEYYDFKVRPASAVLSEQFIKISAKAKRTFHVFHKSTKVYSGTSEVSAKELEEDGFAPALYYLPGQVSKPWPSDTAWDVPVEDIHFRDVNILDYHTLALKNSKYKKVLFAIDPNSGGCAVICDEAKLLVSQTGSVTQLGSVTKLNDGSLDFWCASA